MKKFFLIAICSLSFAAIAEEPKTKISKEDLLHLEVADLKIEKIVSQANAQIAPIIKPFLDSRAAILKSYGLVDGDHYDADGTIHHAAKAANKAPDPKQKPAKK